MNQTEKPTLTPQPHPIEEIYDAFIKTVLETGNWSAAFAAARKLTAENRTYWLDQAKQLENNPSVKKE